MTEQDLYLSKDKTTVMDKEGKTVFVRTEMNGKAIYVEPSIGTKGTGKVCVEIGQKKVCASWGETKVCIGWDTIEYCIKWEISP